MPGPVIKHPPATPDDYDLTQLSLCEWLGNSQTVANKHDLHTTEEHFEQVRKAAHKAAQYPSESTENAGISQQPETIENHENQAFSLENADFQWAMRDSKRVTQPSVLTTLYVNWIFRVTQNPTHFRRTAPPFVIASLNR